MATVLAAMKGKFGSTDYFILAMKAQELLANTHIPAEMPGWEGLLLEEREQRDINYARVKNQIAPYLASDPDRFFGAIIMMAKNLDVNNFEPIEKYAKSALPHIYKESSSLMGFLTLSGKELLIPLDGQHRLKAISFAMSGADQNGKPISGMSSQPGLAEDEVTVILVPHDSTKARKIFTKVNRYAKPTTTGQNLVTDDDDILAVLSREIANDQTIIGARLVKYKSNTLNNKEHYFTTLATLAECNEAILRAHIGKKRFGKLDRTRPVEKDEATLFRNKVQEVWKFLVENIDLFSICLEDKDEGGDDKRREIREDYLLGKPVPQVSMVTAFANLTEAPTNLSYEKAAKKLNSVAWKKDDPEWDRLFMTGGRLITKNRKLVADILYYRAGGKLDEGDLLERYKALFPADEQKGKVLPPLL